MTFAIVIKHRYLVAFLACLALGSCQSAQDIAQEDDSICQGYGLQFGTPDYAQCRQFQQADRTAKYQAYQQRQAIENAARTIQNAAAQKERDKKANQRCYFTQPDKSGWSKHVCESY